MKKEKKYTPAPIDTSNIMLPDNLADLAELLARNVHEVWSQTRMAQGWTYGEERDDQRKRHPCLIPYDELPESEKLFDRNTSQQTLKLIMKLGFRIVKTDDAS